MKDAIKRFNAELANAILFERSNEKPVYKCNDSNLNGIDVYFSEWSFIQLKDLRLSNCIEFFITSNQCTFTTTISKRMIRLSLNDDKYYDMIINHLMKIKRK